MVAPCSRCGSANMDRRPELVAGHPRIRCTCRACGHDALLTPELALSSAGGGLRELALRHITPPPPAAPELVRAILDAPDDDAPRLVYADWLMERGDPRGEHIALQCRPARFEGDVFERAWRLEAEHAVMWLAPLRALLADPAPMHFTRGFVERLVLDAGDWIAHGAAICELTPVREVELRRVESLAAVLATPATARLRAIEVRGQRLEIGDLARVPPLPRLESLALLDCRLPSLALQQLAALPATPRALYLDRNPACGTGLPYLVHHSRLLSRIERLSLDYVSLVPTHVRLLERVADTLRALSVDHTELDGAALATIARAVPLVELSAAATREIDDTTLAALGQHGALRVLRLPRCELRITPRGLAALLAALPQLATLDLQRCDLPEAEYRPLLARYPDACGWS